MSKSNIKIKNRNVRRVVELAVANGCEFKKGNAGNHHKLIVPDGRVITVSGTPSDRYAHKQIMRDLRRHGITI